MTESFYSWLGQFKKEDSMRGSLVVDIYNDITFPTKSTAYKTISKYLQSHKNMFKFRRDDYMIAFDTLNLSVLRYILD